MKILSNDTAKEYSNKIEKFKKIEEKLYFEVCHFLSDDKYNLNEFQHIEITSRIKSYSSAEKKLRNQLELTAHDKSSIFDLDDIIGIRISVFPLTLLRNIEKKLDEKFKSWKKEKSCHGRYSVYKHRSNYEKANCEIQLVPMLVGKFWDVEHSVIYKSKLSKNEDLNKSYDVIINALHDYENQVIDVLKYMNNQ